MHTTCIPITIANTSGTTDPTNTAASCVDSCRPLSGWHGICSTVEVADLKNEHKYVDACKIVWLAAAQQSECVFVRVLGNLGGGRGGAGLYAFAWREYSQDPFVQLAGFRKPTPRHPEPLYCK